MFAVLCLGSGALYAQTARAASIDYKAVPKLEEMKDRPAAPEFTLPNPDGKKISLKDFRGKVVFLNFWATWCTYCRDEMPAMDRLYREFKRRGFEVVAVNVKDNRKDALAFARELKVSYPIVMDPEGEIGLLYGAFGMPTTISSTEREWSWRACGARRTGTALEQGVSSRRWWNKNDRTPTPSLRMSRARCPSSR